MSFVKSQRIIVIIGKQYLRTASHFEHTLVLIQRLSLKINRLLQNNPVKTWKVRRYISYRVLNQYDRLNANIFNIEIGVHLVLDQLDNSQDQRGIAQPAENIIYCTQIFALKAEGNLPGEISKHHNRDLFKPGLYHFCHREYICSPEAKH